MTPTISAVYLKDQSNALIEARLFDCILPKHLIAAAIQLSIDEGNNGRIGLHSLPQSDAFYRNVCGMSDLGPDANYSEIPLRYFEMDEMQAAAFMNE